MILCNLCNCLCVSMVYFLLVFHKAMIVFCSALMCCFSDFQDCFVTVLVHVDESKNKYSQHVNGTIYNHIVFL